MPVRMKGEGNGQRRVREEARVRKIAVRRKETRKGREGKGKRLE